MSAAALLLQTAEQGAHFFACHAAWNMLNSTEPACYAAN